MGAQRDRGLAPSEKFGHPAVTPRSKSSMLSAIAPATIPPTGLVGSERTVVVGRAR